MRFCSFKSRKRTAKASPECEDDSGTQSASGCGLVATNLWPDGESFRPPNFPPNLACSKGGRDRPAPLSHGVDAYGLQRVEKSQQLSLFGGRQAVVTRAYARRLAAVPRDGIFLRC